MNRRSLDFNNFSNVSDDYFAKQKFAFNFNLT